MPCRYRVSFPGFPMPTQKKQKILVVDPDPAIRSLVVALLRRDGYLSDEAGSADTALHLRRVSNHAAVILEPRMLGGDALLQALTSHDTANVIIMTTSAGLQARSAAAPGVRAVLLKPFVIGDLSAIVASCCDGGHEAQQNARGEEPFGIRG